MPGPAVKGHPLDTCMCGDYRRQHKDGTGKCMLEDLCTPGRCQRFRLFQRAPRLRWSRGELRPA